MQPSYKKQYRYKNIYLETNLVQSLYELIFMVTLILTMTVFAGGVTSENILNALLLILFTIFFYIQLIHIENEFSNMNLYDSGISIQVDWIKSKWIFVPWGDIDNLSELYDSKPYFFSSIKTQTNQDKYEFYILTLKTKLTPVHSRLSKKYFGTKHHSIAITSLHEDWEELIQEINSKILFTQ